MAINWNEVDKMLGSKGGSTGTVPKPKTGLDWDKVDELIAQAKTPVSQPLPMVPQPLPQQSGIQQLAPRVSNMVSNVSRFDPIQTFLRQNEEQRTQIRSGLQSRPNRPYGVNIAGELGADVVDLLGDPKNIIIGELGGMVINPVVQKGIQKLLTNPKFVSFAEKELPTLLKKQLTKPVVEQPKLSTPTGEGIQSTGQVISDTLNNPLNLAKIQSSPLHTAEVDWIDRAAPIRNFVKMTEELVGKPIEIEKDPYVAVRLFSGVGGKIRQRLNSLGDILRPERKNIQYINDIMKNQRFIERADRGFLNPKNITSDIAKTNLENIRLKLGNDVYDRLIGTAQNVRTQLSDRLLTESLDAGIISKEAFNAIKAKNQFYAPFDVIEHMADNFDNLGSGKSFNVVEQNVVKGLKGTTKDIDEPLNATVRKVFKMVSINERNKVAQKFINLKDLSPEMGQVIMPIKEGQMVPKGFEKFSALYEGVKKTYAIPKEVASALKGINAEEMDMLTKLASVQTRMLRQGATSLNLAFALPNVWRDFQTAKLVAKTGFNGRNWVKGLASVIKRDDIFKLYEESGAGFSGYFGRYGSQLPVSVQELIGPSISRKVVSYLNPFKIIQKVAEKSELSTRVGVFARGLKENLGPVGAAFESRNATIDFAKMGNKMKVLNLWVPFLNARTQGSLNLAKAVKTNPARVAWLASSMITVPQVSTFMWNTLHYPDVWDSIRQYEKDNNFIFIYGREKDEDGKFLDVVKIPKGDFGRLVGNPVNQFLEFWRTKDPIDYGKIALKAVSDFSPISFEREGELSIGSALSSALPPVLKAATEAVTGKNLYGGYTIVPERFKGTSPREQYTKQTSKVAVKVGQLFNISPMLLENTVGTLFGGLGKQLMEPPYGILKGVTSRFSGAKSGEEYQKDFELITDITKNSKDKKVQDMRFVTDLFDRAKKMQPEQRLEFIRNEIKDKPELIKKLINVIKQGDEPPIYSLIRSLSIDDRIRYMKEKIATMENPEDRKNFGLEMLKYKILTEEVIKRIGGK